MGVNYLGHQEFADKQFFWCSGDSFKFTQLPAPTSDTCRPLFDQIQTVFTGEFDKIIVSPTGVSQYVHLDKAVLAQCQIPARGLSELDRLSHVVFQVDSDCHIVPKGSIKKIPLKEIRRNEAFTGLKADEAFEINNYVHFRAPLGKKKIELNKRNEGVYNNDFLDNASDDIPMNVWSKTRDTSGNVAILRNKLWPGFYTYHTANTNIYGSFYVGNGIKALDMPFQF